MGTPVAVPSDLQTRLGLATIDDARATAILQDAQDLCETIVNPLPVTARGIVVSIAARVYVNPSSTTSVGLGSAHVQYGPTSTGIGVGGLYLSRSDKANLRRLAGGGGAFSVDPLPTGTSAVQLVQIGGSPTGTFTLSFVGQVTAPLAANAPAATVQAALQALNAIGSGGVAVTGTPGAWTVTFTGSLATTPVPILLADGTDLVGGTVSVTQIAAGVLAPGQGLPPWDATFYGPGNWVAGGFL